MFKIFKELSLPGVHLLKQTNLSKSLQTVPGNTTATLNSPSTVQVYTTTPSKFWNKLEIKQQVNKNKIFFNYRAPSPQCSPGLGDEAKDMCCNIDIYLKNIMYLKYIGKNS